MRVVKKHRKKLEHYLKEFYKIYKSETFTILHAVRFFKARLKYGNKDAWIGVAGETGNGKSLFCLMFMVLLGRPLHLVKNICYIPTGSEIIDKFNKFTFQALLIDEAAREMRSVNWQSKAQQNVNTAAMTDRYKNNLVFMNLPRFAEFTKSMRLGNIQFRMIVLYRTQVYARILVQRKSRNFRHPDPWGDDEASKIYVNFEKRKKEITDEDMISIERKLPNYTMDFCIPNLELILPEITDEYEKLKIASRAQAREDMVDKRDDKYKLKYTELLNKISKLLFFNELGLGQVRVSKKDMAKSVGLSSSTFEKYLKMRPKQEVKDFRKALTGPKINE